MDKGAGPNPSSSLLLNSENASRIPQTSRCEPGKRRKNEKSLERVVKCHPPTTARQGVEILMGRFPIL